MPTPVRPPSPASTRLRAAATTIDELTAALPGAYSEQGPPSVAELREHAVRIGEQHQVLLGTAAALTGAPNADTAQRALARALADAAARVGQALATVGRAGAMAARLYEVDGLDGPRAEDVRERAGRELNLALSRTRLALEDAGEGLRREARSGRDGAALPPGRLRAAVARSTAAHPAAAFITAPHPAPTPAVLPTAAGIRR
ncbi:hypothetical protein [Kitasatospora purpeofusca]|uniref:hypothetical protein n=1 Tax=Kitasatospora purpeofusca TaxID=67352 RepID=UPI002258E09E|nr:hypothetical protein [Kitasatospora purpeofusca]MCX4758772.1 hypothetical protein [Kitasatospora purpeofusca]WSR30798.1 hypothetical protein OG715_07330 [Kitasatospora purpeofusca]